VGRFTAFLRAVMPGLAGLSGLSYRRFLGANALGALVWGVTFTLLGYYAGNALSSVEKYSGWAGLGVLVVVIGVVVTWHVLRKHRDERANALWLREHPGDASAKSAE
jgi:membrane protein DedA with SNARE-associated domain